MLSNIADTRLDGINFGCFQVLNFLHPKPFNVFGCPVVITFTSIISKIGPDTKDYKSLIRWCFRTKWFQTKIYSLRTSPMVLLIFCQICIAKS